MKRIMAIAMPVALLGLALVTNACREQADTYQGTGPVVANINGHKITEDKLNLIIQSLPPNAQEQLKSDEGKKKLIDQITMQKLLVDYAKEEGLDKDSTFMIRKEIMNDELLLNQLYQKVMDENPTDDDTLSKFYETNTDIMGARETYAAAHILVTPKADQQVFNAKKDDAKTDEEALQKMDMIQKKLAEGTSFEDLAKDYSEGPSAPRGGDLGQFQAGDMVPEFETALGMMEPGQVSDIVKTRFGYHLIYLKDKGMSERTPFADLNDQQKEQLKTEYYRKIINDLVEKRKENAVIEVNL